MHQMKFLAFFFVVIRTIGLFANASEVILQDWPRCKDIEATQYAMNHKDDRGETLFSRPKFKLIVRPGEDSLIDSKISIEDHAGAYKSEFNYKTLGAVMASRIAAIQYYLNSNTNQDPTGVYPMPFYYFDSTSRIKLGPWSDTSTYDFDFYVVYNYWNVPLLTNKQLYMSMKDMALSMSTFFDPLQYGIFRATTAVELFVLPIMEAAKAPNCGCGYKEFIDIRKDTSCQYTWNGDCFKGFRGQLQCVDVDECAIAPGICYVKSNSHCVNTIGSYECACDPGYYLKDSECIEVFLDIGASVVSLTSSSITFTVDSSVELPDYSWSFSYNITDWSNPTYPLAVYGATQILATRSQAITKLSFNGLVPGKNYEITWDVYDADNNKLTDVYGFTSGTKFKTLCTCGLSTDAPVLLEDSIVQQRGIVYFKFLGNSMCGNAYTFTRQSILDNAQLSEKVIFTPNYFHSGNDCSPVPYQPGKAAADILSESKLTVGRTYRYNIRAVGDGYLGEESSHDFVVRWESSIAGFIGLRPEYGDLPVENVTVRWALRNETGHDMVSGVTTTSKSGRFDIHPKELILFENDLDYPMYITFEKTTTVNETYHIHHQFLCNNGRSNCTDTGIVVHLKHLDFDVPLRVIDATSVPVSGKVYIAGTKFNRDTTSWGADGCAIQKVRVCLEDRSPGAMDNQLICTETAADGTYSLPGTIGSRVSITASYYNHTFQYLPGKYSPNFEDGYVLHPGQVYDHNDFEDRTILPLEITVAGGICDLFLGAATISYRINGCLWDGAVLAQESFSNVHNQIPAHNLILAVESIEKRSDIELPPQNLDLTQKTLTGNDRPDSSSYNITEVRFQYDGDAKIRVQFPGDKINEGCNEIDGVVADSIHVLPFQTPMTAMIFIERDLGDDLVCDAVDPNLRVTIQNNLGILANDPSDIEYAVAVAASSPKEILQLLFHCNQGCSANITHDYNPTLQRNARARVEFQLVTGRPNTVKPHTKNLIVRIDEVKSKSHIAAVVIVGQSKQGDLYSVGLPTYEPLLIIRDPPGGGSYAFYENVQTSIRLRNYKYVEYKGWDSHDKGYTGLKAKIEGCAGPVAVFQCQNILETKDIWGYNFAGHELDIVDLDESSKSQTFTTTWSYKTPSSEPLFAGNVSDTFVVPNLNVKFSIIKTVGWNESSCNATCTEETAYNLESPENVPALAFVTAFEIINTELPYLELNIASTKEKLEKATNDIQRAKLEEDLRVFEDGLQGWKDALAKNEEIKRLVVDGNESYQVKPHEWFEKIVKPEIDDADVVDVSGMSHNSAMVSQRLQSRSKLRPLYEDSSSYLTDLESTNTIKFSGGGNEFSFRLSQSQMVSHMKDMGSHKHSKYHGGILELENTLYLQDTFAATETGELTQQDTDTTQSNRKEDSTAIGFTLSDPDAGDLFDVDVFIDPVYGTFIFHTRSGKSLCKHEAGTVNRAVPKLELLDIPPPIVLEDDIMVFHVRISKLGVGSQGYTLSAEVREDTGGMAPYPFLPRVYPILENEESFVTTFTLRRGPEKYEYPAYTLLLQPSCEYLALPLLGDNAAVAKLELYNQIDPVDQSRKIVFARPCAPILLRGDIAKTRTFSVTAQAPFAPVKVVVQNPNSAMMRWANATLDPETRLDRVQLYYRRAGTVQWQVGQYSSSDNTLEDIDFAAPTLEDAYGFVTVPWEVSHLADGEYEMQVRTVCDDINDAPAVFNGQDTEVIRGVLDRKPPKLYGLPQPEGKLPVGQPIVLEFDEPLDCSLPLKFTVDLSVEGIQRTFDNDNLLVLCEDRTILVQFDRTNTNLDELVGRNLTLVVSDVIDRSRNILKSEVAYDVEIVEAYSECERRQLHEDLINPQITVSEDLLERIQQMTDDQRDLRSELKQMVADQRQDFRSEMAQMFSKFEKLQMQLLKVHDIHAPWGREMEDEGDVLPNQKLRMTP